MPHKAKIPLLIILVQLIAIPFIGVHIYKKYNSASIISVSSLDKNNLLFTQDEKFKHFFEPKPHTEDLNFTVPDWLPYKPKYTINSDSLNERFDYTPDKPADTFRIVTLGDSFVFGLYVNTEDNFTEVLEGLLNKNNKCPNYKKFEVINLGMTGYDMEYAVRRFELRGKKYDPDLVLWFLKQDDFDYISELTLGKIDGYNAELQEKIRSGVQERSREDEVGIGRRARMDLIEEIGIEKIIDYQTKALRSISEQYGGYLFIYSLDWFFKAQDMDNEKILDEFIESRPDTHLYVSNMDLQNMDALLPDYHPNIKGHSLIAEDIFDYLTTNTAILCR